MQLLNAPKNVMTRQTFPSSKSTIETLKKVRTMFKVNNKDTRMMSMQWRCSGVFIV